MTAAALATGGARVDLLCPVPSGQQPSGWERIAAFYGVPDAARGGLRLIELPGPRWCPRAALRSWLDLTAARSRREEGYDFYLVRDPVALTAALHAGRRTIFDSYRYDFHRDWRHWPWRAYCYRHRYLAGAITHSEVARRALLEAGVAPDRTLVAHNGADPRLLEPRLSKGDARRQLGLPQDGRLVVYAGRVGRAKGTDGIPLLARELPDVEFLIVGHIPGSVAAGRLSRKVSALGLTNVRLIERVPPAAVAPYLFASDCLLIPTSAAPLDQHKRTVLPLKVFLYMAAGRAILGPQVADVAEVLRDGHNALLVQPDDVGAAVHGVQCILDDEELQDRLARNALADAQNHSWARRAQKIIEFMGSRM
jgi:glycosyltransferase involved in cell wall biosynthesis